MGNQLYISGELADLSQDAPVVLSFQVNDLSDLKDRQSTYSNSIKLPLTANNAQLFGYANTDAFTQKQPYQKLPCKLIQNGIEQIINGVISLLNVSDSFEAQITYGLTGFADALKRKILDPATQQIVDLKDAKLVDLDWSDIPNFNNDLATIAASQNREGILWPIIDYGDTLTNTGNINTSYLRPGVYYSQILEQIQKYTGYKFIGGAAYAAGFDDFIVFSDTILYDFNGGNSDNTNLPISVIKNLPDFTLKDFLKDYMQRYFLTPVVDNYKKIINFRNFDELYANKAKVKDWSDKFVQGGRSDSFTIGNYAQLNHLLWKEDYTDYGAGVFQILNENLEATVDLLTSIYAASDNVIKLGGITVAQIKKFTASPLPNYGYIPDVETKPRVIHINNATVSAYTLQSSTATQTVPFIITGSFQGYDYLISKYAMGLLRLLKKARIITRCAVLSELDVQNFDFFTPVYDAKEGKYYYVNKINNYISGKKVQVSLIRM